MKKIILIFLTGLVLGGCVQPGEVQPRSEDQKEVDQKFVQNHTIRTIDREAGVVCWIYFATGGISCLPISETDLGKKK